MSTQSYNILFIFPLVCHPEQGGVERVTDILSKELAARGHRIFYLHRPAKKGKHNSYDGYEPPASVHYLPQRRLKSAENLRFYRNFLKENSIHFIINQMGLSKNYCPFTDVAKDEAGFPFSISVQHNPPLLHHEYMGKDENAPKGLVGRLLSSLKRANFKRKRLRELRTVAKTSDLICVLTRAYAEKINQLKVMNGTSCRLRIIDNPSGFDKPDSLPQKKNQLLYVGRLETMQKNPQRLVPIWERLCHRHPDWELVIVGDGPYRSKLEQQMAHLPRVRMVGQVPPEPYFREAALSCLTSSYEGFPMVLLESVTFGTVPLAYHSFPAIGELMEEDINILTAKPFEPDDFAEKLSFLMLHEKERRRLADACLAKSDHYTAAAITDKWEALFAELVAKA